MSTVFSTCLAKLRQSKGVSQRKAAAELGVSQALLSHYENGIREPGLDFVARACDYYGVSSDFLLGRTENKSPAGVPVRTEANSTEFGVKDLVIMDNRLLGDSLEAIGKLLIDSDDRDLVNSVYAYFALVIFKVLRRITKGDADRVAAVTAEDVPLATEAALSRAELDMADRIRRADCYETGHLDERFPDQYNSMMQVVYTAGTKINKEVNTLE